MTTTKSPLAGMPATKDAWKAHMKQQTGKDAIDIGRADRLGLDADTVDKLHAADANKDGRLDWDEAWKAFDDFDSNGYSGSVDLTTLGKSDSALAFARGLSSLNAANDKVDGLRTTKTFDPKATQSFTVDGRTVKFPPNTLAKRPVVDKDWKDRPEISFQLADGTDGRLYNDPDNGWVAVVDHQHYKVDVGTRGDIQIKGVQTDDTKAGVIEGHALQVRNGDGAWKTIASDRAESHALDAGTVIIDRGKNAKFEVKDAARLERAWIGDGNKTVEYTTHFRDGRQVGLRWSGNNRYTVRAEGGDWKALEVPKDRWPYDKLQIQADGTIRAESNGTMGAKIDVYGANGKLLRTEDFTSDRSRDALKDTGAEQLAKGEAAGLDLVNRSYKEQVDHGLVVLHGDFSAGSKQRQLAGHYGKRVGKSIGELAKRGKLDEAKALQKKMVDDLFADGSAFQDADARRLALSAYSRQLVDQGEPVASAMLTELAAAVDAKNGEPAELYLSKETYDALDTLATQQVKAGKLEAAKALYETAAKSAVGGEVQLLSGTKSSDAYTVTTGTGEVALNDPPAGHRVKTYDGLKRNPATVAKVKARQIEFAEGFRKEASALPNLKLSADELNAVPPAPATMKKYFAAKYDGQMPQKMEDMRKELDAYLKAAYAHPELNVPDSVKGWDASGLPTMADGRIAADCFCTNRAVAHMLSGVGGLKVHGVLNEGHSRLAITSADGKSGFVQSNTYTAKLEGAGGLQDRVAHTITKNEGLQVNYGLPTPIRLGASFETGTALTDVDGAFDASFGDAEKKLGSISANSTDGRRLEGGRKVKDLIARYEAFRTKAEAFALKWHATPNDQITDAMRKEKDELAKALEALDKEVSTVRGQIPSDLRRFVDAQKKNAGIFDTGSGGDWLRGGSMFLLNGHTGFALGGSSW